MTGLTEYLTFSSEGVFRLEKHIIVMLDWNKEICKTVKFEGDYEDARRMADKILYSDECYWAYRVEMAD